MKDLKELLVLVISSANVLSDVLEDKKITLAEMVQFFPLLLKVQPAVNGIDTIGKTLMNLTPEQANELEVMITDDLDIDSVKAKEICKKSIDCILAAVEMIRVIKA